MRRRFRITVDGKAYDVAVEEVGGDGGNLYPDSGVLPVSTAVSATVAQQADVQPAPAPAAPASAAGPGDLPSPIAGVVVSIEVAVGAPVTPDTRVATLEAMKTKTVVNAGRDGTVTVIAVAPGDSVEAGQTLLTIG